MPDIVVKAAPIEVKDQYCLRINSQCCSGELAAVSAALACCPKQGRSGIYDSCLIGRVHPLLGTVFTVSSPAKTGNEWALGILETLTIAAGLCAADEA